MFPLSFLILVLQIFSSWPLLPKIYQFCWSLIFSKTYFCFCYFLYFFYSLSHSVLIFIISYFLLTIGLLLCFFKKFLMVVVFKTMVFLIVMYGCESWTIKKAEHWWIAVFELWCRRRLLRVPWTIGRSSPLILKEISPEYSLEGLMLKVKLQSFSHLMRRTDSFEKTLMLGNWMQEKKGTTEDKMVGWLHWVDGREFEQAPGVGDGQGSLVCCSPWGRRVRHNWATELNWAVQMAADPEYRVSIYFTTLIQELELERWLWRVLSTVSKYIYLLLNVLLKLLLKYTFWPLQETPLLSSLPLLLE